MSSNNSRVETLSFTLPVENLRLGTPKEFTLRATPEDHTSPQASILRPQRLMSNSPCRGFVEIKRIVMGDQVYLDPRRDTRLDSFDLKKFSSDVMSRWPIPGFQTLSRDTGVEVECTYLGICPEPLENGQSYIWRFSVYGPGILVAMIGDTL